MSSAFAITTPVPDVDVVPGKPLPLQLTVTNQTGRPVQALARVVTEPAVAPEWATVDRPDRPLATDETQVFTVTLTVPPGAPGGGFGVRLDVLDRDNPDEVGTTGPVVSVRVPGSVAARTTRRANGYLAAFVGTLLGTIGGGLVGFGMGLALFDDTLDESGPGFGDVIGGAVGGAFLMLVATFVMMYVGACFGCGLALKLRRHVRPWVTSAVQVFVIPVLGFVLAVLGSVADLSGTPIAPMLTLTAFCAPPLLARFLVLRSPGAGAPAA